MKERLHRLLASLISFTLWLLANAPATVRRAFTAIAGVLYSRLAGASRRTIVTNVLHVADGLAAQGVTVGSAEEFATRNMRATAALIAETALCWRGPPGAWRDLIGKIHSQGDGHEAISALTAAHARQTAKEPVPATQPGVLLLSPHLGNWELLNMYLGAEFGLTVMYDPPKIAALEPLIRDARQRNQSTLLPIGAAGLRGMVQRLKLGGVVGLLPDQVPDSEGGVIADFLGKRALTINLVHRLANRHHPRVFLVCALRNPDDLHDIYFDDISDQVIGSSEQEAARAMNAAIARRVAQAPEQYQWSYKRFKRVSSDEPNIYRRSQRA